MKLKYGEKAKLCYMDTGSFIVYIKAQDICVDISKVVETRFNTSEYELKRPLLTGKNKKSYLINERLIGWENNGRVCCNETKSI